MCLLLDFGVRPQLLCDRQNLLLTPIVHCIENTCDTTQTSNRRHISFLSQ